MLWILYGYEITVYNELLVIISTPKYSYCNFIPIFYIPR